MQNFSYETPFLPLSPSALDRVLRFMIGEAFAGISRSPDRVTVHCENVLTEAQIAAVMNVLQTTAYGLTVVTDKTTIAADDTDTATVTVSGAVMASDPALDYAVHYTGSDGGTLYEEGEWATGTAAVTAGAATLTFKTPAAGSYHIIVKRQNALHIGRVGITAAAP